MSTIVGSAIVLGGLGIAAPAQAIVGGSAAAPGQWPWMAALLNAYTRDPTWAQYCGGAVIAPRRVLTAAHCVVGNTPEEVNVLVGQTRLSGTGGRRLRVRAITIYPGYANHRQPSLDAAVLTLDADAGVPALPLAQPGQDAAWAAGTQAWTIGWGALNARLSPGKNRYFADRLRQLATPLQSDDACESAYGIGSVALPYRPEWVLCAGTADGTAGDCFGDSGGPLVVGGPGAWLSVGIVIGGDGCASRGYYDMYTHVDQISRFALGPLARTRKTVRATGGERTDRRTSTASRRSASALRNLRRSGGPIGS